MKLIFLGPPGAGKGTQAKLLCEELNIAHISTGDMLRANLKAGTKIGLEAKSYMDQGALVPDSVLIGMVRERVKEADCQNGYALDGFPRTIPQADALFEIADIDMVINLIVPDERIITRIGGRRMCKECDAPYHTATYQKDTCEKCGGQLYIREDDKPETVRNRLEVYQQKTQPLIEYYAKKGMLRDADGDSDPKTVNGRLLKIVRGG